MATNGVVWDDAPTGVVWDDEKPKAAAGPAPSGVKMGLGDLWQGSAQMLTNALPQSVVKAGDKLNNWLADKTGLVDRLPAGGVDQAVREREATYKAQREAAGETGMDWGRTLGNVINPAALALGAVSAPAAGLGLGARMLAGAGAGGAMAGFNPVGEGDYAAEKAKQIAMGAAGGGVVPALTAGVGRMISPNASRDAGLQLLQAEGVKPTIGQTLGGIANRMEEKMTAVPIMGDAIKAARDRTTDQLNVAVANRALAPVGQQLPAGLAGREAVRHVEKTLGRMYDDLLPRTTTMADAAFSGEMASLRQMMSTGAIDPKAAKAFSRILQNDVLGKFQGQNAISGQTMKAIESDLGAQAKRFAQSTDPDARLIGDGLKEVQSSLRKLVARNNPQEAAELKAINEGWANFKRLQRASSYVGAEDGVFTPGNLQSAVKAGDWRKDKAGFADGTALMQDLSDPAKRLLGGKVPDSGTAGRAFMGMGALASGALHPAIPAGLLGGAAMYLPQAQSLLRGAVASRPLLAEPIAGLLNQASPMFAPAGGLLGYQFLNQ